MLMRARGNYHMRIRIANSSSRRTDRVAGMLSSSFRIARSRKSFASPTSPRGPSPSTSSRYLRFCLWWRTARMLATGSMSTGNRYIMMVSMTGDKERVRGLCYPTWASLNGGLPLSNSIASWFFPFASLILGPVAMKGYNSFNVRKDILAKKHNSKALHRGTPPPYPLM